RNLGLNAGNLFFQRLIRADDNESLQIDGRWFRIGQERFRPWSRWDDWWWHRDHRCDGGIAIRATWWKWITAITERGGVEPESKSEISTPVGHSKAAAVDDPDTRRWGKELCRCRCREEHRQDNCKEESAHACIPCKREGAGCSGIID